MSFTFNHIEFSVSLFALAQSSDTMFEVQRCLLSLPSFLCNHSAALEDLQDPGISSPYLSAPSMLYAAAMARGWWAFVLRGEESCCLSKYELKRFPRGTGFVDALG